MSNEDFCKIVRASNGQQVLCMVEYDDDDDRYYLRCITRKNGIQVTLGLGVRDEAAAFGVLERFDVAQADALLGGKLLKGFMDEDAEAQ